MKRHISHEKSLSIEGSVLVRWMERAIHLFRQGRSDNNNQLEKRGEVLLERIMGSCSSAIPITYGGGVCGIGVGIAYLLQEGFVEGDSDEILGEIDYAVYRAINTRSLSTLGLNDGVCGLAYYLYYRLHRRIDSDEMYVLRMKEHVVYLIDWIAELLQKVKDVHLLHEAFCILCLLHQLNVLNAKIEKLMEYSFQTMAELYSLMKQ